MFSPKVEMESRALQKIKIDKQILKVSNKGKNKNQYFRKKKRKKKRNNHWICPKVLDRSVVVLGLAEQQLESLRICDCKC